jgi:hypothetical protein
MKSAFLISSLIALHVTSASAEMVSNYYTGDTLTRYCRSFILSARSGMKVLSGQQGYETGMCYAYVVGVLDTLSVEIIKTPVAAGLPTMCLPSGLNANNATEIVANYVDKHPERRQESAYWLVRRALGAAYPCK